MGLSCSGYSAMSTLYPQCSMFDENKIKTGFRISRWLHQHHLISSDLSFGNNAILPINIRQCCTLLFPSSSGKLVMKYVDHNSTTSPSIIFYLFEELLLKLHLDFWKELTRVSHIVLRRSRRASHYNVFPGFKVSVLTISHSNHCHFHFILSETRIHSFNSISFLTSQAWRRRWRRSPCS